MNLTINVPDEQAPALKARAQAQGLSPRLTEGGWAVVNRTQRWTLTAVAISILSFVVSVGSLVLGLATTLPR